MAVDAPAKEVAENKLAQIETSPVEETDPQTQPSSLVESSFGSSQKMADQPTAQRQVAEDGQSSVVESLQQDAPVIVPTTQQADVSAVTKQSTSSEQMDTAATDLIQRQPIDDTPTSPVSSETSLPHTLTENDQLRPLPGQTPSSAIIEQSIEASEQSVQRQPVVDEVETERSAAPAEPSMAPVSQQTTAEQMAVSETASLPEPPEVVQRQPVEDQEVLSDSAMQVSDQEMEVAIGLASQEGQSTGSDTTVVQRTASESDPFVAPSPEVQKQPQVDEAFSQQTPLLATPQVGPVSEQTVQNQSVQTRRETAAASSPVSSMEEPFLEEHSQAAQPVIEPVKVDDATAQTPEIESETDSAEPARHEGHLESSALEQSVAMPTVQRQESVLGETAVPTQRVEPLQPKTQTELPEVSAFLQGQAEDVAALDAVQRTVDEVGQDLADPSMMLSTGLENPQATAELPVIQRQVDPAITDVTPSHVEMPIENPTLAETAAVEPSPSYPPVVVSQSEQTSEPFSDSTTVDSPGVMRQTVQETAVPEPLADARPPIVSEQIYSPPRSTSGAGNVQCASLAIETSTVPTSQLPNPAMGQSAAAEEPSVVAPFEAENDQVVADVQMKPAEIQAASQPPARPMELDNDPYTHLEEAILTAPDSSAATVAAPAATPPVQRAATEADGGATASEATSNERNEVYQSQSLEEVWPVDQVQKPTYKVPELIEPVSITPPIQEISRQPSSADAQVQAHLQTVASEQPSDSSIELVLPRRPRPVIARKKAASPVQQEADTAEVQNHAEPYMVETEIGALPSDLWQILGKTPPAAPPANTQRAVAEQAAIAAVEAPPVSSSVEMPLTADVQRSAAEPDDVLSFDPVFPEIQRDALEGESSAVSPDAVSSAGPAAEGEQDAEKKTEELDLDALAEQVYATLRQRLRFEQERNHRIY